MTLQTAFAQTQRAIIGIESLRRMMPARPDGPIVESFADFHLRQCTLVCLFFHLLDSLFLVSVAEARELIGLFLLLFSIGHHQARSAATSDSEGVHTATAPKPMPKLVPSPEQTAENSTSYSQVSMDQGHRP